ncbi:MAG: FKBP-type peptidyl-prolyl cis-trans isomerase [Elusimicrobiaceae bacterium]|nr:FKBP-type peptidyl-prolyl cis-trans isomerase [Elusimicrobiaceae bacterium]
MKKLLFVCLAFSLCMPAFAQEQSSLEEQAAAAVAATAAEPEEDIAERNKMLYSLGFLLGDNLKKQLILDNEDDYKALSQGMRDSLLNKESQTELDSYKPQIIEKYQKDAETISQRHLQEQKEYLENFSKEKGVKVLDNGAMIKLSKKGKGRTAKADSRVTVNYEGKLIDGTKFDSSYDRNEPFTTKLTSVVPCWTKALQQMRPASKATVVCPAETAYGNRPVGVIPAGSTLIFTVELISIDD